MKLKKRLIFNIISIIFLSTLIVIYGYRLIYYYKLENKPVNNDNTPSVLADVIITNQYPSDYLVNNDNDYLYHGNNPKNYLKYSGLLWRIVKIKDKQIIAVLDSTNILLSYNDNYLQSDINLWLNSSDDKHSGIFYNNLSNKEAYLNTTNICLDVIEDLENITCENINNEKEIGILSLKDYQLAGGGNSYLNNHTNWWLSNVDDSNNKWYITSDGQISKTKDLKNYGVRPIITINNEVIYVEGQGTKDEPFIIEDEPENVLNQKPIGSYLKYSNNIWKIVAQEGKGTKIVMDGYIKVDNEDILKKYSTSANYFSLKSSNIGYYLNNTFYDSLINKNYIIESKWYIGSYSINNDYHYQNIYKENIEANIGLLNIADLFVNEYPDTYTITGSSTSEETVYTINSNNELYRDFPTKEMKIRPSLYLDANLIIKDGNGSKDLPYEIEG